MDVLQFTFKNDTCPPTFHESINHHRGPLLSPKGLKDKNLVAQKISTGNMDPFAEQHSEHHFNILQTCIPANKEKADTVWERKEIYLKKEQP